jgi:hypothetical protein
MAVEVMVRISPRMFHEDASAFRSWLEQTYPVDWRERAETEPEGSLSAADLVLAAVFTGIGEAVGESAVAGVRAKIRELAERYRGEHPPPAEVESRAIPEPADPTGVAEPGGISHDAH